MKKILCLFAAVLVLFAAFPAIAESGAEADSGIIGVVRAADSSNVRESASADARAIGKVSPTRYYTCLGYEAGWYRIELEDGSIGYVSERRVDFYRTRLELPGGAKSWTSDTVGVGDVIEFGHYVRELNAEKYPIEWIVLDREENSNLLLVSRYAIDRQHYHTINSETSWKGAGLRTWLNTSFLTEAFTEQEQACLLEMEDGDRVTLLDIGEAEKYLTPETAKCVPTSYSISRNSSYDPETGACWWWLRSNGKDRMHAAYVNENGEISTHGYGVISNRGAVRPVIRLSRNSSAD
jgi:hypothetical protein